MARWEEEEVRGRGLDNSEEAKAEMIQPGETKCDEVKRPADEKEAS
jgi:hypothetical protein